jgi:hypothetical protein
MAPPKDTTGARLRASRVLTPVHEAILMASGGPYAELYLIQAAAYR